MSEQTPQYTTTAPIAVTVQASDAPATDVTQLDPKTKRALIRYFVTMKKAAETMLNELGG